MTPDPEATETIAAPPERDPDSNQPSAGSLTPALDSAKPVRPGSKYHPLYAHLIQLRETQVNLEFGAIEQLIGSELPASARAGRAFWSNRGRGALQAAAWMLAGYHVSEVDLERQVVTFVRPELRYQPPGSVEDMLWDAHAVLALRRHMGVNQAGLAEVLGVRQQTVSEWERGVYAPTRARSKHLSLIAERADFPYKAK